MDKNKHYATSIIIIIIVIANTYNPMIPNMLKYIIALSAGIYFFQLFKELKKNKK